MSGRPTTSMHGRAWFAGRLATHLVEVSHDAAVLDGDGLWVVVADFEGLATFLRFAGSQPAGLPAARPWTPVTGWTSTLDEQQYCDGVHEIRRRIGDGSVYQVNLCRVLSAPAEDANPWGLAAVLAAGNPAPYPLVVDVPDQPWPGSPHGPANPGERVHVQLVSASPELFLRRDGDLVATSPIKGTATHAAGLTAKDEAENVMIVDLARNDLSQVCRPGSVEVTELLGVHEHPGLVHLESTVTGRLRPGVTWPELLSATMPPASVSGAPKSTALQAIADLERGPRGPYCGALGWVDCDRGTAQLAVGIRTFWWQGGRLCFGTGAGITAGSDPQGEWAETQLKAHRLVGLATGRTTNEMDDDSARVGAADGQV